MLRKSLFISKKKESNCGIFSHFSWVVFYIVSPIFTEIKCAPQKRWSYTIKWINIKNVLGRSRMFDTTSVFLKWITVIRKRSCKKQYRTSRNVRDFPQKNKNENIATMEYFFLYRKTCFLCVVFLYQSTPFLIFWWGSFAVQYADHLRSGIIRGLIWESFSVQDRLRYLFNIPVLPKIGFYATVTCNAYCCVIDFFVTNVVVYCNERIDWSP